MDYQKIHIDHLNKLYDITGEPILKEYADKFNKYLIAFKFYFFVISLVC